MHTTAFASLSQADRRKLERRINAAIRRAAKAGHAFELWERPEVEAVLARIRGPRASTRLRRATEAAQKAGLPVAKVELTPGKTVVLSLGSPGAELSGAPVRNPWDE